MSRFTKAGLAWLAGYLLMLGLVVWGVYQARYWALANLNSPTAQAEWDQWRHDAAEQSATGPVRRPKLDSPEPPTLVLLRDYFALMLAAGVVFYSLLFGTIAIAVQGALGPGRTAPRIVNKQPWNS